MWDKICQVSDIGIVPIVGSLEIFGVGPGTTLWHNVQNAQDAGGGFAGWEQLGQPADHLITSGLAVGVDYSGGFEGLHVPDVLGRGADSALWHLLQFDPVVGWAGEQWQSLGGVITSDPVSMNNADGTQWVFARGTDNALWVIAQLSTPPDSGKVWAGAEWQSLGGELTSGPAVALQTPTPPSNPLDVYVRGTDSALYHIQQDDQANWGPWERLGGVLTSDPAVIVQNDGITDVFARGDDMALWTIEQTSPGDWKGAGWESLGGVLTSNPVAFANASGQLDVFARGTDSCLYHIVQGGDEGTFIGADWERLGRADDKITSDPVVTIDNNNLLNVFAQGTDNALLQIVQLQPGLWVELGVGVAEFVSLGGNLTAYA